MTSLASKSLAILWHNSLGTPKTARYNLSNKSGLLKISNTQGLHGLVDPSDANRLVSSCHGAALDKAHLAAVSGLHVFATLKKINTY